MSSPVCVRPGCRAPVCAIYSAPQYPKDWRGPLCDKHAERLHEKMTKARDQIRQAIRTCRRCDFPHSGPCPKHSEQLAAIGAAPPTPTGDTNP